MGWFNRFVSRDQAGRKPRLASTEPGAKPAVPSRAPIVDRAQTDRRPRAQSRSGVVHRSEYLSPDDEARLVRLNEQGMPTARLRRVDDRLIITPDAEPRAMVNPKSNSLYRIGLFSFGARGTSHYPKARLALGKPVRLVREPYNPHDASAIAIHTETGTRPFGYVNKQNAARLAKLIDGGASLSAICVRAPGSAGLIPMVLVARPEVLTHLMRKL